MTPRTLAVYTLLLALGTFACGGSGSDGEAFDPDVTGYVVRSPEGMTHYVSVATGEFSTPVERDVFVPVAPGVYGLLLAQYGSTSDDFMTFQVDLVRVVPNETTQVHLGAFRLIAPLAIPYTANSGKEVTLRTETGIEIEAPAGVTIVLPVGRYSVLNRPQGDYKFTDVILDADETERLSIGAIDSSTHPLDAYDPSGTILVRRNIWGVTGIAPGTYSLRHAEGGATYATNVLVQPEHITVVPQATPERYANPLARLPPQRPSLSHPRSNNGRTAHGRTRKRHPHHRS